MGKLRSRLIERTCPRCGKKTVGLRKPIHGSLEVFNKFKGICAGCLTNEESTEIMRDQMEGIVRR